MLLEPDAAVRDRAEFSRKILFAPKIGQKWVKNRAFSIYWKIWSLILAEFDPR